MARKTDFINDLKQTYCLFEKDILLSTYTSFKIGGKCHYIIFATSIDQLGKCLKILRRHKMPYYIMGKGSNILVSDKGYNGTIISMGNNFSVIRMIDEVTIECDAGTSLSQLCTYAMEHSLSGLEFAYGIPGTVGGAVYMNAGAYDGEIKDVLESCVYFDSLLRKREKSVDKLKFSYRHSIFAEKDYCILTARFRLKKGNKDEIAQKMNNFLARRKEKQPLEYPSAGSTFKRPNGNYASALIEQCGLKGKAVGGAMVSEKHSGFVINYDRATSSDVINLIELIQKEVFEKTGYKLECEVKTLGI